MVYVVDQAYAPNEYTTLTDAFVQGCDALSSDDDSLTIIMNSAHVQNVFIFSPSCNMKLVRGPVGLGEVSARGAGLMLMIGKSFQATGIKFHHPEKVALLATGGTSANKVILTDSTFVSGETALTMIDFEGSVFMDGVRVLDGNESTRAKVSIRNVVGGAELRSLQVQGHIEVEESGFSSPVLGTVGISVSGTGESGSAGYSFLKMKSSYLTGPLNIMNNGFAELIGVSFRLSPSSPAHLVQDSNWDTGGLIANPVGSNGGLTSDNVVSIVDFDGNGCADFPKENNKKNAENECQLKGKPVPRVP